MSRVKLCGLRRPADIQAANRCRPDYVGFVFAGSKRRVTPKEAMELKGLLDPGIPAVGVFVGEDPKLVAHLCREGTIDMVQLHGDEDGAYIHHLRELTTAPIIKALRVGDSLPPIPEEADYPLFDTLSDAARGGTGEAFDWSLLMGVARPYFLAGGLTLRNVEAAIRALCPFCVDVSSGIETEGWKDPAKMEAMVEKVRSVSK